MEYFVAWWNVENLFDVVDSHDRPVWLQKNLQKELAGWTDSILEKKLDQLVSVIKSMNNSKGPDLLGVCEVENRSVLKKLVAKLNIEGRKYAFVHSNTKDSRGIDIAFIYDNNLFKKPYKKQIFNHVVLKRNATRDIVQVNFRTKTSPSHDLVVIGNHWPSRRGGKLTSEPYRIMAAETLSYWIERIHSHFKGKVPIVVMGDFNDEPYDRAITDYAYGLKDSAKVKSTRTKKPYLLNLMWPLQEDEVGTYYFNGWGLLDQILVNRSLLNNKLNIRLIADSCQIYKTLAMIKSGKPRRFNRPSSSRGHDPNGFSDHLPISVKLMVT